MFSTTIFTLAAFAAFPQTFATVFLTAPVASTTCSGGQTCQIAWNDDGNAPTLPTFGPSSVGVWVGSAQQQTQLQFIQDGVNVATTASITFTVDATIGPNSDAYFIRFTSDSAKDPTNPQFPVEAFSAKFTLANMSGQFNSTVQAQINGASSAPIPTPSAASTPSVPSSASKPASSSAAPKTSASSSGAAKSTQSSAAIPIARRGLAAATAPVGLGGILAALFAFVL